MALLIAMKDKGKRDMRNLSNGRSGGLKLVDYNSKINSELGSFPNLAMRVPKDDVYGMRPGNYPVR